MKLIKQLSTAAILSTAVVVQAADLDITVTNLTQGLHFTPLIVGVHDESASLFEVGGTATMELQMMAEGGEIGGLETQLRNAGADTVANPAKGLLAPATSAEFSILDTKAGNDYLSIAAMLLPTNDGFVGLSNWKIPAVRGTYTIYLNAYDAGTEANDEIVNGGGAAGTPGIPAAPGGNAGSNGTGVVSSEDNMHIHIHRGVIGDTDSSGGASDLDSRIHRWLNPVAKVTVIVR